MGNQPSTESSQTQPNDFRESTTMSPETCSSHELDEYGIPIPESVEQLHVETDNDDVEEPTLTCSSIFQRKQDPLVGLGNDRSSRTTEMTTSSMLPWNMCETSTASCGATPKKNVNSDGCAVPRTSSWSSMAELEMQYTDEEVEMEDGDLPTFESDLRPNEEYGCRHFHIVTTAALPWFTGTSINPLLRAGYFSRMNRTFAEGKSSVTLVVPWLESEDDRAAVYGDAWREKSQLDQEAHIRSWLADTAGMPLEAANPDDGGIEISWYPARWHPTHASIFPMGDICANLTGDVMDVCFLEEPEHLNWYKASHPESWTDRFAHVVGIGHTNYLAYLANSMAVLATPTLQLLNSWMVRAYCHKLIKLSGVLQTYAPDKEVVCNVHGIRQDFLVEGQRLRDRPREGAYFLGKLAWTKGLDHLIELEGAFKKRTGSYFPIDIIGSGPEQEEIVRAFSGRRKRKLQTTELGDQGISSPTSADADENPSPSGNNKKRLELPKSRHEFRKAPIPAQFLGRQDHLEACKDYKVFVNPSTSEVLCTATAEAIAMNKFVLVPAHPSNNFFAQFPNCLRYKTRSEFIEYLQFALSPEQMPPQLSEDEQYPLTWEAATERCMDAAVITRRDAKRWDRVGKTQRDRTLQRWHNQLAKGHRGNIIRAFLGGGPVADQYVPEPGSTPTPSVSTGNLFRAMLGAAAFNNTSPRSEGGSEDDDGEGVTSSEESSLSSNMSAEL